MSRFVQVLQTRPGLLANLVMGTIFCSGMPADAQYSAGVGTAVGYATSQSPTTGQASGVGRSVPVVSPRKKFCN
jgi:hypothetical protein